MYPTWRTFRDRGRQIRNPNLVKNYNISFGLNTGLNPTGMLSLQDEFKMGKFSSDPAIWMIASLVVTSHVFCIGIQVDHIVPLCLGGPDCACVRFRFFKSRAYSRHVSLCVFLELSIPNGGRSQNQNAHLRSPGVWHIQRWLAVEEIFRPD